MPIFAPFSYLANPIAAPTPAWDPSDFTNVQYWWRADSGVTTGTGGVSNWVDQINSFDLKQTVSGDRPSETTNANLNSKEVISFNGSTDFLTTEATPASRTGDFMILMVYSFSSTTPGNGLIGGTSQFAGGGAGRIWLDGLNGNQRLFSQGLGATGNLATTVESGITTGAHAFFTKYDASAGDLFYALDTLTESTSGTAGNTNQGWLTNSTVAVGAAVTSATNNSIFLNRHCQVDIAELVYVYDSPTSTEMDEWETYVNTRYGTIIS